MAWLRADSAVDCEDVPLADVSELKRISPADLDDLLAKAQAEQWTELVLLGPDYEPDGWPEELERASRVFQLTEHVEGLAQKLSSLNNLASLNLASNDIGDEGAVAVAALTNLASLDLFNNKIGAQSPTHYPIS